MLRRSSSSAASSCAMGSSSPTDENSADATVSSGSKNTELVELVGVEGLCGIPTLAMPHSNTAIIVEAARVKGSLQCPPGSQQPTMIVHVHILT